MLYDSVPMFLTLSTAWLTVLLFAGRYCWPERPTVARWLWTAGLLSLVVHISVAFAAVHDWHHGNAVKHTALRTEELIGLRWGGGIYANYAFAVVWLVDLVWWWVASATYSQRPKAVRNVINGFLLFIAINAAVVFAQGLSRWIGIAMFLPALVVQIHASRKSR